MTDKQIKNILNVKGRSAFRQKFMYSFNEEWNKVVKKLKESGANLSNCLIVPVEKEYQKSNK